MLPDPLSVKSLDLPAHTAITIITTDSFAVTDVSPGRTVRACSALTSLGGDNPKARLTISHSVSNENKPTKTDRVLVRLDADLFDVQGNPTLVGSAYLVLATPRGAYVDSAQTDGFSTRLLFETLLGVVCVSTSASTLSETNLDRIIAGEP